MNKIEKMASGEVVFNPIDVYDKLDELIEGYNELKKARENSMEFCARRITEFINR